MIDQEFLGVFTEIIGKDAMEAFCKEYPDSYNDFIRELEKFKENIFSGKKKSSYFRIPLRSLNTTCKKYTEKEFLELVKESVYNKAISELEDKISLVNSCFILLFMPLNLKIVTIIKDVLQEQPGIRTLLVVGGFSQSKIVQTQLKKYFPDFNIILPSDPGDANVAVVKGAVLYGHRPNFITSRISQYTYGRLITPPFNKEQHDSSKRKTIDGRDRCLDVFEVLVEKNTSVEVGRTITKEYKIAKRKTERITIAVFITKKDKVIYVDEDGCKPFCELILDITEPSNKKRFVVVHFEFGSTEFQVSAVDKETGQKFKEIKCTLK